ncbi:DUF7312 domain-containing protein [Halorhabdus salina]|uniref:DUF7312 domain-containing protein n=1 Tax=Halorhabdus salina TaxID=2750670 RepID=UPI0015EF322D|nr:hypothetical protein [Halorhabdus salina]
MTDDEWEYDTGDFEPSADDPPSGEKSSDDGSEESATGGWRFSVDEVEDGGTVDEEDDDDWLNLHEEIEAGSPTLENALFVVIGVTLGLVLTWQLFL